MSTNTQSLNTPSPILSDRMNALTAKLTRRGRWRSRKVKQVRTVPQAKVSDATRQRLIHEAVLSPAYEGMNLAEVTKHVDESLAVLLKDYPWWYGHLPMDKPKKAATPAQLAALERARQARNERKDEDAEFNQYLAERRKEAAAAS